MPTLTPTTITTVTPTGPRWGLRFGRSRTLGAIGLGLLALATAAYGQDAPVRVRGTIESAEGGVYVVKSRDGSELKLKLVADGKVSAVVPAKLADIKQGLYIGVAALPQADGSQKALEVHIFPEP